MYIHIASTLQYNHIVCGGDIWLCEVVVIVQELDVIWLRFPQGNALKTALFTSHFCDIFNTDNRESVCQWSDDETWCLLTHISPTVAFHAALWWNPSRFIWPQGRDYVDEQSTDMSEDWADEGGGGGGRESGVEWSASTFRTRAVLSLFHLYCVCRGRENESPSQLSESHRAKDILNLTGLERYREIKQHTKTKINNQRQKKRKTFI